MSIGIISWIVVGLIAGILGKLIMPGRDPGGFLLTIVIGMIGALLGGFVVQLLGGRGVTGSTSGRFWWPPLGRSYCWPSTGRSRVVGGGEYRHTTGTFSVKYCSIEAV